MTSGLPFPEEYPTICCFVRSPFLRFFLRPIRVFYLQPGRTFKKQAPKQTEYMKRFYLDISKQSN